MSSGARTIVARWGLVGIVVLALWPASAAAQTASAPTPRLTWSVPERYDAGWAAWDDVKAKYDPAYVRPPTWRLNVNACGSSGNGRRIESYEFRVRGVGFAFAGARRETSCATTFANLPRLGRYDVTLVLYVGGVAARPLTTRVVLRDYLIVSAGDSMASGEGNPDTRGRYKLARFPRSARGVKRFLDGDRPGYAIRKRLHRETWKDRRCHRSAHAGHALVAKRLEQSSPQSSVTYVSLACSGAEIGKGMLYAYAGQELKHRPHLPPQVLALRSLVGPKPTGRPSEALGGGRRIDALLLSIGINDLGFSGIVESCATNLDEGRGGDPSCVYKGGLKGKLKRLGERYDWLAGNLGKLIDAPEVYITDYPGDPFGDHACGLLGLKWYGITSTIGITDREARAMRRVGDRFASVIIRAAERNRWNYVGGMTRLFGGHDYCQGDRFLRQLEESLRRQGNKYGAVHPNQDGHAAMARLLLASVVVGRPDFPRWKARLTILRVRVGAAQRPGSATVNLSIGQYPWRRYRFTRRFTVPRRGQFYAVPQGALSFDLDVYQPPRPPRYLTAVDFVAGVKRGPGLIGAKHTLADGLGAGEHTIGQADIGQDDLDELRAENPRQIPRLDANAELSIVYRVDVQKVGENDLGLVGASP